MEVYYNGKGFVKPIGLPTFIPMPKVRGILWGSW